MLCNIIYLNVSVLYNVVLISAGNISISISKLEYIVKSFDNLRYITQHANVFWYHNCLSVFLMGIWLFNFVNNCDGILTSPDVPERPKFFSVVHNRHH